MPVLRTRLGKRLDDSREELVRVVHARLNHDVREERRAAEPVKPPTVALEAARVLAESLSWSRDREEPHLGRMRAERGYGFGDRESGARARSREEIERLPHARSEVLLETVEERSGGEAEIAAAVETDDAERRTAPDSREQRKVV